MITNPTLKASEVNHRNNLLTIRSKNIQRNQDPAKIRELAHKCDVLLIQETVFHSQYLTSNNLFQETSSTSLPHLTPEWIHGLLNTLKDSQKELIYTNTSSRTGIILNLQYSHFQHISSNNLDLDADLAPYATDAIIKLTEKEEYILIISVYGPSGNYPAQAKLFTSLHSQIDIITQSFKLNNAGATFHVCLGGDFNMVLEPEIDSFHVGQTTEVASRDAFNAIFHGLHLHDTLRGLDPQIKLFTNDNFRNCRRLDRIYLPASLKDRVWRYQQHKEGIISSTHITVEIDLVILPKATLKISKPRFIVKDHWLDNHNLFSILRQTRFSDYTAFIKRLPRIIGYLRNQQSVTSQIEERQPPKIFKDLNDRFKGATHAATIVSTLTTADRARTAITTKDILEVQREHLAALYLDSQAQEAKLSIRRYLQMFRRKVSDSDSAELEKPITYEELTSALQRTANSSTPGEDGMTYLFLKAIWDKAGPLLTKDAENIMQTGILPESMALVLIRLIPKRKRKDLTVDDFRPISLINTSLRVISQVLNMRLQKVTKDLIGYDQCGFMPERQMDFQIQRFRALIDKVSKDPETLRSANIIILDLTKAFDRISHDYLSAVLDQLGFGPRFKRILLLVTTQQFAAIFTNNTKSETFPLKQGTRQGNPVLPILFNLCLEPLLQRLQSRLEGIPIQLDHLPPLTAKYSAFADDLTVFVNGPRDHEILKDELTLFEQASNSLVSIAKSRTCHWGQSPPEEVTKILGFEVLDIRTTDYKYLGVPLNGFRWDSYISSLSTQLHFHTIQELPIHLRCTGFNTYIFSKIYFRDLHDPMANDDIKHIKKMIKRHLPHISDRNLSSLKKKGGFGLLNVQQQLLGRRATVIYDTLTNLVDWNLIVLRDKLQSFIDTIYPPTRNLIDPLKWDIVPWYLFLVNYAVQNKDHAMSAYKTYTQFTRAEIAWLEAWFTFIKPKNRHYFPVERGRSFWINTYFKMPFTLNEKQEMVRNPPLQLDWDTQITSSVDRKTFTRRSAKYEQQAPVCSSSTLLQKFPLLQENYPKFWKALYKVQLLHPKGTEELHRVHLGHRERHGNPEALEECVMCLNSIERRKYFHHTYQDCEASRTFWNLLGPEGMNLDLNNIIGKFELPVAAFLSLNRYFLTVYLFQVRRRNSEDRESFSLSTLSTWVSILQSRRLI